MAWMGWGHTSRALVLVLGLSALAARCGNSPATPTPIPEPEPPPPPPPTLTITCPSGQSGLSIQNQPVAVSWPAPATTGGAAPVQTACTPASGTPFTPGVTTVTCSASDAGSQRASCGFSVTITRPPQIAVTRFLAFGDSITWGKDAPAATFLAFPEPPPATSYPTQLAGLLTARYLDQTIVMVNEGWPGEAVREGLSRLPGVIDSATPEVLLLLDGANDLLGRPERETTAYIASRLQDMVRTAKRTIQPARILLATFPPQYHGTIPYDRGAGADFVPELNERIASVAQAEGVTLVDLYTPLLPGLKQNIGADGLHPTVKGFTLMAEAFAQSIRQAFELAQPTDTDAGGWMLQAPNAPRVPGSPAELRPRLPWTSMETPARRRSSGR